MSEVELEAADEAAEQPLPFGHEGATLREWRPFVLEGPAQAMSPGPVMVALASGARLTAGELGAIVPVAPGQVTVEIGAGRAAHLSTPLFLSARVAGRPACYVLRRPDDEAEPFEPGRFDVLVVADGPVEPTSPGDARPGPSPAALARALGEALGLASEDLGFGLEGGDFVRVSLPLSALARVARFAVRAGPDAAAAPSTPPTVDVEGRRYRLEILAKKT